MELYWKTVAAVLLAVVLTLALDKQNQDIRLMLSIAVCIMSASAALSYLEPVVDFIQTLEKLGNLQGDMIGIILKAVGIGLVAEIAGMICADSGNASLGKTIQLLGTGVVLWLSLPVFTALLDLIQQILGEL